MVGHCLDTVITMRRQFEMEAFMKWFHKERVKGTANEELRLGIASWDDGTGSAKSIKYTWFDKLGRAARGGEMPVDA